MTSSASDRNLLFGILALQMDFITRDGLIDGMQAWTLAKTQSLGEVLVDRELMPQSQRDVLEQLVDAHIAQHGGDAQQSLQGLSSAGITSEALQIISDPDVQASLLHVPSAADREAGTLSQAASAADFDAKGRTLVEPQRSDQPELRFQILRPHAEGGLGRVSIAVDREFNREVAFKEIKSQHRSSKDAQQRFMLEAEVTGGLEHPGIVPVYGLGHFQDGRPFYAMRFIRGDSLQEAIDTFHQQRADGTSGTSRQAYANDVQFRDIISRFIDVCFAMEYAHSRGVLHRDLKPGNIMLGKYGETLVVDWGLAKATADAEDTQAATGDLDQETPLVPGSGDYGAATQMGRALGTPQFMSPEQAAGRLDELGPTTDVYSLGATLYQVLTGVAPIGATTSGSESDRLPVPEILKRVQSGQFPHPRSVNPDVPAGLEAICLKAMSRNPKDRYPTAKALLADLKAWMADEPVAAWTEPLSIRARRWVRGHQVAVGIAATALLILATVSPVMTLQQSRIAATERVIAATERQNAATEKENASKQSQLRTEAENAQKVSQEQQRIAEAEKEKAVSAERKAEADREEAVASREQTEATLARSNFFLAQARWDNNRAADARELLKKVPQKYRNFEWYLARRQFKGSDVTLFGHTSSVRSVSFSPDGTRIASGSHDKTIKLWDAATGEELHTLKGHTDGVWSVSFSPDGTRIASGSRDKTIRLWDASTGEELRTLTGHTDDVWSVSFSPDGTRIASGSYDKTIRLWDASTGEELRTLTGHTSPVWSVSFSPDGTRIASGSRDKTIRLWDASTGEELRTLTGHTDDVWSVSFSPDGTRIASGSHDKTIRLWDASTGEELRTLKGHTNDVTSVSFSPDGTRIASGSRDTTIRLWDASTGEELRTLTGHTDDVWSVSFSPDGTRIASGSADKTIRLWDAATGEELHTLKGHTNDVTSVSFSPDGTRIASGSRDTTIRLWDASTGEELRTLKGHTDGVLSVSFSPDGKRIASGSDDKTIRLWDASTGEELHTLKGHRDRVTSVSFSPDGQRIASGSADKTIRLWDASTGEELHTLKGHTYVVLSVSFSPDGTRIASGSMDKTIRLWDASTGEELHTLKGHTSFVNSVSFNADGTRIASGSYHKTIRLWDASTGEELRTLKGHTDRVTSVSFRPDGKRLLSRDNKGQKLIWDLESGAVLPDGNVEEFPAGDDSSKSSDGRWLAIHSGTFWTDDVLLVDLAYKQTPRERQRRKLLARPKPRWHSKQFQSAQSSKQWYPAVFHAAWLLKLKPSDEALHDDLQEAHRQLLAAHDGQSPPLPAVVKEMLKLPRGSDPPAEANN